MRNDSRKSSLWRRIMLVAALSLVPVSAQSAPGDILFSDDFERAALFPWTTTNATASGILSGAAVSGSPTRGAFTRHQAVTVTSPTFNAAVPSADFSYWIRRGADAFSEDPDNNEDLIIEYQRSDSSWAQIVSFDGSGPPGQIFTGTQILPPDAMHAAATLRFRQTAGSGAGWDYWHVDDFVVRELAPAPPLVMGSCDDFENGLNANWTINATSGFAGTNPATSQSPTSSMFLNGGVVDVSSLIVDTTAPAFTGLTMWIRRGADAFSEDPDGGENLVVEYLDDVGGWVTLETFSGAGGPGAVFIRTYNLPAAGRHSGFRLRFRQTAGSGATWDFWHVDDVCFVVTVPNLVVSKSVVALSDPVSGGVDPKSIPGATMLYTINVSNEGPGTADADSLVITDPIPADTALFVDTGSGDPIVFVEGPIPSGLGFVFAADVEFSNQVGGGPPFSYVPIPDVDGFDPVVTGIRVSLTGLMNAPVGGAFPSFEILFRVRVE